MKFVFIRTAPGGVAFQTLGVEMEKFWIVCIAWGKVGYLGRFFSVFWYKPYSHGGL
jgi:hypothetical protein